MIFGAKTPGRWKLVCSVCIMGGGGGGGEFDCDVLVRVVFIPLTSSHVG